MPLEYLAKPLPLAARSLQLLCLKEARAWLHCTAYAAAVMIRFMLLQNRQGKTRLAKYYVPLEESEKHKLEHEIHRLVANRDPKFTNFVEV